MKRITVFFFLTLFLVGIGLYISYYQNPFVLSQVITTAQQHNLLTDAQFGASLNDFITNGLVWSLIDTKLVIAWLAVWAGAIISAFTTMHLLIDKLFFRKFYEEPDLFMATRRGTYIALTLVGAVFLKLINGLFWYNLASIILLFICLEILLTSISRERRRKKPSLDSQTDRKSL
jgi:hypothetical protein